MKNIYDIVKNNPLFDSISFNDFEKLIGCLSATKKKIKKNESILKNGARVNNVYIILSGTVKVIKESIEGKENILAKLGTSEIFAEVFACANISHSPVTVTAIEESEVLLIDYNKVVKSCSSACVYHTILIENMLKLLARKNLMLQQKVEIISKRTIRERLMIFFDIERKNENKFTITFSREALADYLCVDRSAMSNEISKMQKENIIKCNKNEFEIIG